jgi:PAS domain S-box-containing protein
VSTRDSSVEQPTPNISVDQLWDATSDGVLLVCNSTVLRTNAVLDGLFGYQAGELIGQPVETLVPAEVVEAHVGYRSAYEAEPTRRTMGRSALLQLYGRRKDGSTFPLNISLSPVTVDGQSITLASVRDMSELHASVEALAAANRRRAVAEDHQRLARELHDNVIQHIFAIGLELQSVNAETDDPALRKRLDDAVDGIDAVIARIRQAIFDLHRSSEKGGLREQVVAIAGEMTQALGFDPEVRLVGPIDHVPDELSGDLVSVIRECLANAARHAEADSVTVLVDVAADRVRIEVGDDGVGMPDQLTRRSGLGNLAQRAAKHDGSFTISSEAGKGTTVEWSAPLRDAAG